MRISLQQNRPLEEDFQHGRRVARRQGAQLPAADPEDQEMLNEVPAGGTLEVLATDPGSVADLASFCRTTGNELMESTKDGDVFRFVIKRAG